MANRKIIWQPEEEIIPVGPQSFDAPARTGGIKMVYYYPNRPTLIPPSKEHLDKLEASGRYIAERKWNGDNTLIDTAGMRFWNRRKELHRYKPCPEAVAELDKLPKNSIINAELMHYKTKTIKEILIVHAIMVYKGKPLIGKTWGDSRKIIKEFEFGEHVKLSETFQSGFWDLFQQADGTIIEGIILKDPAGKLVFSTTPIVDVSWMLKIRKPCKKYRF
jgi:hypothetical protein